MDEERDPNVEVEAPPENAVPAPTGGVPVPQGPPAIGPLAAIGGIFFSPKETFARLVQRPWWWVCIPVLVVLIASMASSWFFVNRVDMGQLVRDQIRQSRFASQMSDEQIEKAVEDASNRPKWVSMLFGAIGLPVLVVVLALIFWLVLLAFGAEINFGRSLQVTGWAMLPLILLSVIFTILLFVKDPNEMYLQNAVMTNPAAFLDHDATPKPLYALLKGIDVFKIWIIALLSLGLAAAGRTRTGRAALVVVSLYGVWVLITVGLAAIF